MMQAADIPCIARPAIRNVAVPAGEMAISNEPIALRARPTFVSFTRPNPVREPARDHNEDP